jgi:DNA-binding PadR family transcriptional regulator
MTSPTTIKRHEESKLSILKFLAKPDNVQYGETLTYIKRPTGAGTDHTVRERLNEMLADGLVEIRNSHPRGGNSRKPYVITQKGKDYLAEAASKLPESALWVGRVASQSDIAPQRQAIAAVLRRMPEFRSSNEERIQQVGQEIARAISAVKER